MTIQNKLITYEEIEGVGYLTLNREDKLNALNTDVLKELEEVLIEISKTQFSVNGIIFTGAGEKAFIAGADIAEMSDMSVSQAKEFGELGQRVTLLFEKLQLPVIACVNGFALGGGCEMAMSCDFIYATNAAVFGQPEVKLGLIPGFGGTQRLSKLIGRNKAKEIVYTGRNVKADEALSLGLVNKVFDSKGEMLSEAKKTILRMTKNSPYAISIAKKVMNTGNDLTVSEGLHHELNEFSNIFNSQDMKEGCRAFVDKRAASFKGC